MKKIKIGIFPIIKEEDNSYLKSYEYLERYLTPLIKENVKPIFLITLNKDYLINSLKECDAMLIPGGDEIDPLVYDALEYAYQNKLPVLGICMGMQTICVYSKLRNYKNWDLNKIKEIKDFVIKPIGNNSHHQIIDKIGNLDKANIDIFIEPTSRVFKYFNKQIATVKCFHNEQVTHIDNILKVTSFAKDGILESVESVDDDWLLIGVEFHPELSIDDPIIKGFLNDIKKE